MSKCISHLGEYGEHVLDQDFVCGRCSVQDEAALIADRDQWRARAEAAESECGRLGTRLEAAWRQGDEEVLTRITRIAEMADLRAGAAVWVLPVGLLFDRELAGPCACDECTQGLR